MKKKMQRLWKHWTLLHLLPGTEEGKQVRNSGWRGDPWKQLYEMIQPVYTHLVYKCAT